ncbi:hypothetical protein ACOMHN_002213 [Nucella lapillus]
MRNQDNVKDQKKEYQVLKLNYFLDSLPPFVPLSRRDTLNKNLVAANNVGNERSRSLQPTGNAWTVSIAVLQTSSLHHCPEEPEGS